MGVEPHVLRYWETEFPTIRPRKSTSGQRVYSQQDVDKLLRVKELLRNQGFSIAGAKKRLRDAPGPSELAVIAEAHRETAARPETPARRRSIRRELLTIRRELVGMLDELADDV